MCHRQPFCYRHLDVYKRQVLDIRRQCIENNISFWFKQTGYRLLKGEREYKIARQFQHTQARKAGINYSRGSNSNNYSD